MNQKMLKWWKTIALYNTVIKNHNVLLCRAALAFKLVLQVERLHVSNDLAVGRATVTNRKQKREEHTINCLPALCGTVTREAEGLCEKS